MFELPADSSRDALNDIYMLCELQPSRYGQVIVQVVRVVKYGLAGDRRGWCG